MRRAAPPDGPAGEGDASLRRMALIDQFLPDYRLRDVSRTAVVAPPERTWAAVRALDLNEVPLSRQLFALRLLPERLRALWRKEAAAPAAKQARIEEIVSGDSPFELLGERPGEEVVIGAIGRFWQPRITWAYADPAHFAAFHEPGFGKLAWGMRVAPRESGGSWITVEVRVTATDDAAWARFRAYWFLIGRFSLAIRRGALALLRRKLGGAVGREAATLIGDELVPDAHFQRTHQRFLDAPPRVVWPWLLQMGSQRAGWYSIDRLDNAGAPSARQIIPELQHLQMGDLVPATPTGASGFGVLRMEPERALVLGSPELLPNWPPNARPFAPFRMTWAFSLEAIDDEATLLRVRVRGNVSRPVWRTAALLPWARVAHEIMERAQLRHLHQRVLRHSRTFSSA